MHLPTSVMAGGLTMASIMGVLLIWWLSLDGSGFVGFLFIIGMLVGIAVFAGGAIESATDRKASSPARTEDPVVTTQRGPTGAQ